MERPVLEKTRGGRKAPVTASATASYEGLTYGGRFRATRRLKEDREVATFLGTDLERGTDVVIKTTEVSSVPAGVQTRLEHEADVLRRVHSPFLTPLLDVGREGRLLFLTMPYVPGVTLRDRLRDGSLAIRDALSVAGGIIGALRAAHEEGVLHRDVKPENVIVDTDSPLREVTLIDFGLARSARLSASLRDIPVGTAIYMSPEQAGLLHQEVDERADLYSAGVVLFECLTGRPPFDGATVGDVLRQQMTAALPDLRRLGLGIPRALAEVVQHMLEKDPRDRYQTAEAVASDIADIADALERGESEPQMVVGLKDRRRSLREPALIGREGEVAVLEEALEQAARGNAGAVTLEAESGGGKTRLLDELARRGAEIGALVLRGHGLDQAARAPYQMLEPILGEIVLAARSEPALAARIRERLDRQEDAAVVAAPELAELLEPSDPQASPGLEEHAQTRTIGALTALLDTLGSPERPALLLFDDCQWADDLTIELLRSWRDPAREGPIARHVVVVLAYRSEEVGETHALRRIEPSTRLELAPLDPPDVRRLAESMAGRLPDDACDVIARLSSGSPLMAAELLRGLVETGALTPEPFGWRSHPRLLSDAQSSRRAAALLAQRLERLPPEVLRLLSAGAVLGKEFDLDFARALAGQTPSEASYAVHEARRRHIVWADPQGVRYSFLHDKLREALLERLTAAEHGALHRAAAERIETIDPERIFDLAYHFAAGGANERALPYALAAAEMARSRHTLEIAEQQCRVAERASSGASEVVRRRITELLGDVLMLRGRYAEAEQYLSRASSLAHTDVERAQIEGKLGELAFKRGEVKTASATLESALQLLRERIPGSRLALSLRLAQEVVVQVLHTLLPRLFVGRRSPDGAEAEFLAIRLYSRLAYAYWFHRGRIACAWAHLREMNLAERYPPSLELAQAYSEHAPVMTMVPHFKRGIAYAERSLAIRKELGDAWGQGQSLNFYGIVLYASSRFEDAIERCREGVSILERTGDPWETNTGNWHIAFSQYRLGDLREAVALSRQVYEQALRLGDNQVAAISLGSWSKASGGAVPRDLIRAELRRSGDDVHATAELYQAEAVRLMSEGRSAAAVEILEQAWELVDSAGFRQEYVAPVLPWLATALRTEAEAVAIWNPSRRRALLKRARWAARKGMQIARRYPNNLPHVLRECALIAAMEGRTRKASRLLERSLATAERQHARYEHAKTLLARGEVGLALGWPSSAQDLRRATEDLEALGAAESQPNRRGERPDPPGELSATGTLSLADRFSTIVDAGRHIVSALSKDDVFSAARQAVLTVLRSERCIVLAIDPDTGAITPVPAGDGGSFSRTLVRRALAKGAPEVLSGTLIDDPSESLEMSETRSALCAPIFVRGKVAACLYATHGQVGALFGEDEERIAEFISALAGAALENSEGFAKVERLSVSLQRRATELERSNADLQQFAHAASHDLSEPLRMVSSYVQLLAKRYQGRLDNDADEFIQFAVEGTMRMQALIQGLLDYSRAGTAQYALEDVDCEQIVEQSMLMLKTRIEEVGAHITVDPLPTVRADPTQFAQLFQNLLSNAIKFKSEAPPEVHVTAERENGSWLFSVADNGIGVAPEYGERIFAVFQRLHSRDAYPGSGIGLAICKRIVERHGGRLWVEPRSEGGSVFRFTISAPGGPEPTS